MQWNGADLTTTYVSANQVTATVPAADIALAGTAEVTVIIPGGNVSNPFTFTIDNPVPAAGSLSPASALVGSSSLTLTVNGSNFVSESTVQWNGSALTSTFVSSTKLTATVPAGDTGVRRNGLGDRYESRARRRHILPNLDFRH